MTGLKRTGPSCPVCGAPGVPTTMQVTVDGVLLDDGGPLRCPNEANHPPHRFGLVLHENVIGGLVDTATADLPEPNTPESGAS